MKRSYVYVWMGGAACKIVSFAGMLFNGVINVITFFSIKRGCESIFRFVSIIF